MALNGMFDGMEIENGVLRKYHRSDTEVTIPDGVTRIDSEAFDGCIALASVTIGDSVTSIGENAFSGCSGLTSITIGAASRALGKVRFPIAVV